MGDPNAVTPNLDRLVADGVTFTRAGVRIVRGARRSELPCTPGSTATSAAFRTASGWIPALPTIAGVMGAAGYDTAHFGKWHLDGAREADDLSKRPDLYLVPKQRRGGFGTWIWYENNRSYFDCHVHGHRSPRPAENTSPWRASRSACST